jgi:thymidylate synthase (FAD)
VEYQARRQDDKNRQNSVDDMTDEDKQWFVDKQEELWDLAKTAYDEAIQRGVAKEQARFILPLNTATTLYMTGSARSWIHYIQLRSANGTQREHAEIALAARSIIAERFPDVAEALGWTGESL